jgi:endonuclease/exonuclease/phosphatase family metal-dependent hydrolase
VKILDWNILFCNKRLEEVFDFISESGADVVCLQEVPLALLHRFERETKYYITHAIDFGFNLPKNNHRFYMVILTKNKPQKVYSSKLSDAKTKSLVSKLSGWHTSREFCYVDIQSKAKKYRIFNLHLEAATNPVQRLTEFQNTLKSLKKGSLNIVCGDLNIYGKWFLNLFIGWMYDFRGYHYFIDERKEFEIIFSKNELLNTFYKMITYPILRLQHDHILIPENVEYREREVYKQNFGSDHLPILLEI